MLTTPALPNRSNSAMTPTPCSPAAISDSGIVVMAVDMVVSVCIIAEHPRLRFGTMRDSHPPNDADELAHWNVKALVGTRNAYSFSVS